MKGNGQTRAAFTLVSLVATMVVLGMCAGLLITCARRAQERRRIILCQNHLKQFGLACRLYADENEGRFPVLRTPSGATGVFAWDLPGTVADGLIQYGMSRKLFYCPSRSAAESEIFWNISPNPAKPEEAFRVIGYGMGLPKAGGVRATNMTDVAAPSITLKLNASEIAIPADKRELLADATISQGTNEKDLSRNRYTGIQTGFSSSYATAHMAMNGRLPGGGNIAFLDSHVDWRPFSKMRVRTDSLLTFWW